MKNAGAHIFRWGVMRVQIFRKNDAPIFFQHMLMKADGTDRQEDGQTDRQTERRMDKL